MKTPEAIAANLAASGAVLHLLPPLAERHLVGELSWLDAHRIFWFTAHGERKEDGHVLVFDHSSVLGPHAVEFLRNGRPIAHLTSIAFADVEDRDDYTVAFSIWRQIGPTARAMVEDARENVLAHPEAFAAVVDTEATREAATDSAAPLSGTKPKMSDTEMDALLAEVGRGVVSVRTALSLMTLNGVNRTEAAARVFHALGGRDKTEIGPDGRSRYAGTGKLVCEVERMIAAADETADVR